MSRKGNGGTEEIKKTICKKKQMQKKAGKDKTRKTVTGEGMKMQVCEKNNNVFQPPKSFCAMLMTWV